MNSARKAVVHFASNDFFIGITPSGHSVTLDTSDSRSAAPTPVELLLIALGSCTAVDVAGILAKRREHIEDYRVEVWGERRAEHPRSYVKMAVHHIVRGRNISEQSLKKAIELSETKYCSVAATLRPAAEIVSSYEIIEA